ncbi:hypothetical protein ACO9S2_01510 [Nitrospira sp. NS4]|uniref:hypothetical protein n=1 Tax=Nitrospira sp. NS4 TaxID=3414498 RepID=UPI003C2FE172
MTFGILGDGGIRKGGEVVFGQLLADMINQHMVRDQIHIDVQDPRMLPKGGCKIPAKSWAVRPG